MFSKSVQKKKAALKAVVFGAIVLTSVSAFADEGDVAMDSYLAVCGNLPLVDSLISGKPNTDVCVDAPVALTKAKVVFDMASDNLDPKGRHTGLRHMYMLGLALQARITAGQLDPSRVSVIGIMHGNGLNLALKDVSSPITKGLMENIFALKAAGVNINLEVCGVTMHGGGYNNADLYVGNNGDVIHVNQGAIGRLIDLEQHRYALIKESD